MIELEYKTKKDQSVLNPPQYMKLDKIYNLILIPYLEQYKDIFDLKPSDSIKINNKSHKIAIESGRIILDNQEYFFLYIAPGFKYRYGDQYSINYNNISLNLETTFSEKYSAKILYGLIILSDNFYYLFDNHKTVIISDGSRAYNTNVVNIANKYNFYMAQKNNTLINILNNDNLSTLKLINQPYQDSIFIRPLYNTNYPLGQLQLLIKGVNNRCGLSLEGINFTKKLLIGPNKSFTIDNLSFGTYHLKLFDQLGNLMIDFCNGQAYGLDSLNINIDKILYDNNSSIFPLLKFYQKNQPIKNKGNLLVNLPINDSFEIKGPNNFYQQFTNGYQYLQNIPEGYYTVITKNSTKSVYVVKNDNNYLS